MTSHIRSIDDLNVDTCNHKFMGFECDTRDFVHIVKQQSGLDKKLEGRREITNPTNYSNFIGAEESRNFSVRDYKLYKMSNGLF